VTANRHLTPGLTYHPPAELSDALRAEAARRGVPMARVLTDALRAHLAWGAFEAGQAAGRAERAAGRAADGSAT
jgi:hypothetical protein